jgi:hypothetical protein
MYLNQDLFGDKFFVFFVFFVSGMTTNSSTVLTSTRGLPVAAVNDPKTFAKLSLLLVFANSDFLARNFLVDLSFVIPRCFLLAVVKAQELKSSIS